MYITSNEAMRTGTFSENGASSWMAISGISDGGTVEQMKSMTGIGWTIITYESEY
jgi:hypothetical protein